MDIEMEPKPRARTTLKQSIRTKIIAWSVLPTAIVLVFVAWAAMYAYQQMAETIVVERDQEMTRLIADELARVLLEDPDLLILLTSPRHANDAVASAFAVEQIGNIVRPRVGSAGRAYLVDNDGRIFYHFGSLNPDDRQYLQPAIQRALEGGVGGVRLKDDVGRELVASFAPVPGTDWGLITEEGWDELIRSSLRYQQLLLVLLALGVAAPVLAITIGARHITRPIADLIGAAKMVASGNFGHTIHVSTGDELEELARQFNHMAAQLQASYTDLERKVADRTKELATLNTVAASVNESLDLDETLNRAVDELLALLNLEVGEIRLLDNERNELVIRTQRGLSQEFVRRTEHCDAVATLPGHVLKTGELVILENLWDQEEDIWISEEGLSAIAISSLRAKEKPLGTLCLATRSGPRPFSPDERKLLHAVSDQIGVAIDNARLYEQAQQLAVMEERNRLARDLHDSVTQSLYGVTLFAEAAGRLLSSGQKTLALANLQEIKDTAQEALQEMRLLIFELRPRILGESGLAAAIQARLDAVEGRAGLETTFKQEGIGMRLFPEVEEGLYRIAQETLNNALKHAHARHVDVMLRHSEPKVVLQISDDGVGFDPDVARQRGGFGLQGMEERAAYLGAHLSIHSRPGAGTEIMVEINT